MLTSSENIPLDTLTSLSGICKTKPQLSRCPKQTLQAVLITMGLGTEQFQFPGVQFEFRCTISSWERRICVKMGDRNGGGGGESVYRQNPARPDGPRIKQLITTSRENNSKGWGEGSVDEGCWWPEFNP